MNDTSLSLIEELRRDPNGPAWERFFNLYCPLLFGWLRKQGLQDEDANDLTQDVLAVVLKVMPSFEYDLAKASFRGWLRGIMMNKLKGFRRARQHRPLATGDSRIAELAEQLADPHSALSRQWDVEQNQHLARQVMTEVAAEFEPVTVDAFRGVMLEEADPAAVAERLGISVNAVYLAKFRVLRRVRQRLAGLLD
jgi:RNA polymerase sigma-70 factor (ECF subfamily)